jgi:hypothetical protein
MKKEELIKLIEEAISPCNSTYKAHREETAKRIFEIVSKYMGPPEMEGIYEDGRILKRGWKE